MTSKEALEQLKNDCNPTQDEAISVIEKDLKILEILKKHSTRLDNEDWNSNIFNGIDYENLDEEERKVIKEWLENE